MISGPLGRKRTSPSPSHAPYVEWAKLGLIAPIGESIDPAVIAHKIAELNGQNHITALAFDRSRINDLKRELDAIGCHVPLEPHGQGYKDMSCRIWYSISRTVSDDDGHRGELMVARSALSPSSSAPWRAAMRRWSLTARRGRASQVAVPALPLLRWSRNDRTSPSDNVRQVECWLSQLPLFRTLD